MRKLVIISCLSMFAIASNIAMAENAPVAVPAADTDQQVLKLTEGYFQNGGASMPLNLLKSTEARRVQRGDPLHMWLTAKAIAPSPCDKKSENPCKTLWLLKSGERVLYEFEGKMRWDWESTLKEEYDNMLYWTIAGWNIPRSVDDGPMTMSFTVSKDGETLFSTEVHFEIE